MGGSEIEEKLEDEGGSSNTGSGKKKIFVAGATGSTGKRIVEQLLAKGFSVKAGVRDIDKAKTIFPANKPHLEIVSLLCYAMFIVINLEFHYFSSCCTAINNNCILNFMNNNCPKLLNSISFLHVVFCFNKFTVRNIYK